MDKAELIITALQQRLGELTASYEVQIAVLRAEITQIAQREQERQKAVDEYSAQIEQKASQ